MCETTLLNRMMDVQTRASPRMADDSDEDDKPLSFMRNNTVIKQTHSNAEVNKSSSQNNDSKSGGQHSDVLFSNGQSTSAQNSSSKSPPMRSPLPSPQASSSSVGRSPLASPKASPNASPVVREEKLERKPHVEPINDDEDSDDDKPLSSKIQRKSNAGASTSNPYDSDDEKPLSSKIKKNGSAIRDNQARKSIGLNKRPSSEAKSSGQSSVKKPKLTNASMSTNSKPVPAKIEIRLDDDDENDQAPISQGIKKPAPSGSKSPSVIQKVTKVGSSSLKKTYKNSKKAMKKSKYPKSSKLRPESGKGKKWTSLEHNGVFFPPPYKPHGVQILYDGKLVDLTPEQEEVATMYAVMLRTKFLEDNREKIEENFWSDWRKFLGKNHVIQNFKLCDFDKIKEWHDREKDKKKLMSKEEKKAIKEEKMKLEEKYTWAIVDGVKEKVGNFRVEPPGLFRGRGKQPKIGKLKKRVQPSDIVINIGKDAPVPECPIPGQSWKEVRHDNTVTWLAYWDDPVKPKKFKYVQLAGSSSLKGQSDKEKYEKARELKDYIQCIRTAYTKDFGSKDDTKKQIAVATYLIDKLALRAGNEKDDDEAPTVGCCTLKVEHVEPKPPNMLKFKFLGKDSIWYVNEVEVEIPVYKAIQQFRSGKTGGDDLFDKLDTSKLNAHLKGIMPGLTAKVFRTYNASITLDEMLSRETKDGDIVQKLAVYQRANKEVAIICNHQRTPSETHDNQIKNLDEKIAELKAVLEELETDLSRAKKGKPPLKSADGKPKKNMNPEAIEKKISKTNARIEKIEQGKATKEDLKEVALGTSKMNYLDPRITVAWCKRHEVPIEKIFTKTLLAKFAWSMDDDPSFRF